jgi:hypothetical protein
VPLGGYPVENLSGLDWGPGYSGASAGWESALFDLSSAANDDFQVRFVFGSDESITDLGWYLDDIAIATELDRGAPPAPPGIEENPDPSNSSVMLEPVLPNPFSASTRLRYSVPATERVTLTIHDASGRLVRRLVHGIQERGVHEQDWDGTDEAGRPCANGVYFGRLTVGGVARVRSLLRVD